MPESIKVTATRTHSVSASFATRARQHLAGKRVPITNNEDKIIGSLELISSSDADDAELLRRFTRWRNQHMNRFTTSFEATEARTSAWLNNCVLPAEDRVLFKMLDNRQQLVGHVGVIRHEDNCEIDNLIRCGFIRVRDFTFHALQAVIRWSFEVDSIKHVSATTFSDNHIVLDLEQRLGYLLEKRISVSASTAEPSGDIVWVASDLPVQVSKHLCKLTLPRERFMRLNQPWPDSSLDQAAAAGG